MSRKIAHILFVILFLAQLFLAQSTAYGRLRCVQQPESRLVYRNAQGNKTQASEWSCSGGTKKEAFDLLADAGVAPMAFAKVEQLSRRVNAKSRKSVGRHLLEGAAFVAPYVAFKVEGLSDGERAGIAMAPNAIKKGIELIAGFPDQFERTPEQDGFVTLYSQASLLTTVPPPVDLPAVPELPATPLAPAPLPQPRWELQPDIDYLLADYYRKRMNYAEAEAVSSYGP